MGGTQRNITQVIGPWPGIVTHIDVGIHHFKKTYTYIWYPSPKTDVFEVATLLGQITLFSLSSSGGYHIYIYTHMCVLLIVVLLLNPGT